VKRRRKLLVILLPPLSFLPPPERGHQSRPSHRLLFSFFPFFPSDWQAAGRSDQRALLPPPFPLFFFPLPPFLRVELETRFKACMNKKRFLSFPLSLLAGTFQSKNERSANGTAAASSFSSSFLSLPPFFLAHPASTKKDVEKIGGFASPCGSLFFFFFFFPLTAAWRL